MIFIAFASSVHAQTLSDLQVERYMQYRVKTLEQLISRFNRRENAEGKTLTKPLDTQQNITKSLWLSLYDSAKIAGKIPLVKKLWELQVKNPDSIFLDLKHHQTYALVETQGVYEGVNQTVWLTLVYEKNNSGFRWALKHGYTDIVKTVVKTENSISPVAHEVYFTDILRITEKDAANIWAHTPKNSPPDQLALILYWIQQGKLKITSINKMSMFFFDIPNWIIKTDFFNRSAQEKTGMGQSGWLISDLLETNEFQKNEYKKYLHEH